MVFGGRSQRQRSSKKGALWIGGRSWQTEPRRNCGWQSDPYARSGPLGTKRPVIPGGAQQQWPVIRKNSAPWSGAQTALDAKYRRYTDIPAGRYPPPGDSKARAPSSTRGGVHFPEPIWTRQQPARRSIAAHLWRWQSRPAEGCCALLKANHPIWPRRF
ncbi:MAG: hypothetical protein RLZZ253_118 [Verrucomicrobiota bacterium]